MMKHTEKNAKALTQLLADKLAGKISPEEFKREYEKLVIVTAPARPGAEE